MTGLQLAIAACTAAQVAGIAAFALGVGILLTGRWSR